MKRMANIGNVKDTKIMKSMASAAKLDQEAVGTLSTELVELQKKLIKLNSKKPKMSL